MLLGLAPWGPPVPTLYLLMNTICRLPSSAGTDAIFSISMTNPSSHLSHFVSEEKEGQAEMGKPALGASCKRLPSAPISSTPQLSVSSWATMLQTEQRVQQVMSKLSSSRKGRLASFTNSARQRAAQ